MTGKHKSVLTLLLGFLLVFGVAEFVSFATLHVYDYVRGYFKNSLDPHFEFNRSEEQNNFFSEYKKWGSYKFKAFVGWKNEESKGNYLNIDSHGRRVTGHESKYPNTPTIRFFGGSAMWGHSVSDESTIPALIGNKEKLNTVNYAEQGYNSRQSLNVLIENIGSIKKDDLIVFYDGVNDAVFNCKEINSTNGHGREGYLNHLVSRKPEEVYSITNVLWFYYTKTNLYKLVLRTRNKLSMDDQKVRTAASGFACDSKLKAEEVANFLLKSWRVGEILANKAGASFACVLQPNPYTLGFKPRYYDEEMARSIEAVYPLVREKGKTLACFVDLSKALQIDHYVDSCCHTNSKGNEEITKVLVDRVIKPNLNQR